MSKKVNLGKVILCLAAVFGLAAICMVFVPAVKGTGKLIGTEPVFSGTQVVFGYKDGDTQILNFNFLAFLGLFVLPIAATALTVASFLNGNKTFSFVAAALFLVSAILAFLTVASFKSGVVSGTYYDLYTWKLAIGAILSGVFSVVACCALAVKEFMKF